MSDMARTDSITVRFIDEPGFVLTTICHGFGALLYGDVGFVHRRVLLVCSAPAFGLCYLSFLAPLLLQELAEEWHI
jgi:hypothetical protein